MNALRELGIVCNPTDVIKSRMEQSTECRKTLGLHYTTHKAMRLMKYWY